MNRSEELLKAAAKALDDGKDPFDGFFLREHDVTANEMFALAENVSMAVKVLLAMSPHDKATYLTALAMTGCFDD
jgi:hypothetical protein